MTKDRFVKMFDPKEVHLKHVAGKQVIYLDNMVWIDLSDQRTDTAKRAFDACCSALDTGRAIFPVSYSAIGELVAQQQSASQVAQARVMDRLSQGVSFRTLQQIHKIEVDVAVEGVLTGTYQEPDHSVLYSYIGDASGDGSFRIPAEFPEDRLTDFCSYMSPYLQSLEKKLSIINIAQRQAADKELFEGYINGMKNSQGIPENMESALFEERRYCLSYMIMPIIQNRGVDLRSAAINSIFSMLELVVRINGKSNPHILSAILERMPSIDLFARIMAARAMDTGRKISKNDFFDTEHARFAAYADYFFTERNLAHILNNVCKVPQIRPSLHVERGLDRLIAVCAELG